MKTKIIEADGAPQEYFLFDKSNLVTKLARKGQ